MLGEKKNATFIELLRNPCFITYAEHIHKNLSFFGFLINNNIQLNDAKHNIIMIYYITYIYIYT